MKTTKNRKTTKLITLILFIILSSFFTSANNKILSAEGSIKYIGKPNSYSPPFILLSSSQRFYTTEEIYNNLVQIDSMNKYFYFKIKDNKVVGASEKLPEKYTYTFPDIMRIDKFEFNNYNAYYIIWYFNFSQFVELNLEEKYIEVFYTSPNSLTIKIPKNYKGAKITIKAVYKNQNITQERKYVIKI